MLSLPRRSVPARRHAALQQARARPGVRRRSWRPGTPGRRAFWAAPDRARASAKWRDWPRRGCVARPSGRRPSSRVETAIGRACVPRNRQTKSFAPRSAPVPRASGALARAPSAAWCEGHLGGGSAARHAPAWKIGSTCPRQNRAVRSKARSNPDAPLVVLLPRQ